MRLGFIIHACECIHVMWPTAAGFRVFLKVSCAPRSLRHVLLGTNSPENLYTQKPLHIEDFTQTNVTQNTFEERNFWTQEHLQKPLQTETITTQKSLHTEAFTHRNLSTQTRKNLHTEAVYTETFAQRNCYTKNLCRKNCLDKGTFTDESVCKQKPLRAQKPLHAETVIHRSLQKEICYTKKRLQKEIFRIL